MKSVENLHNTAVVVANRTIRPGSSVAIPVKDLTRWLDRGGQRMLDANMISISPVREPAVTVGTSTKEAPVKEVASKETPDPAEVQTTFDGAPVSDLLVTPEERKIEERETANDETESPDQNQEEVSSGLPEPIAAPASLDGFDGSFEAPVVVEKAPRKAKK